MSRARARFTQADIKRAVSGFVGAGLDVGGVEISPDGSIRIIRTDAMPKRQSLFDELEAAGKL